MDVSDAQSFYDTCHEGKVTCVQKIWKKNIKKFFRTFITCFIFLIYN